MTPCLLFFFLTSSGLSGQAPRGLSVCFQSRSVVWSTGNVAQLGCQQFAAVGFRRIHCITEMELMLCVCGSCNLSYERSVWLLVIMKPGSRYDARAGVTSQVSYSEQVQHQQASPA